MGNDLVIPCMVIDVSDKCHERCSLSVQDIIDFEGKYRSIVTGSCVMIKSGWSKFWNEPSKYPNNHVFPSLYLEAAELLLKRGVNALGIDTLSPDRPGDRFKMHKAILGADKIILENVANLGSIPPNWNLCYGSSYEDKRWYRSTSKTS